LLNGTSAQYRLFSAINGRMPEMMYIKSYEYNITNNYNDTVKMILRSRLEANIKYVVTTLICSAIKMGFLDKIDNVSGSNVIKKVLH